MESLYYLAVKGSIELELLFLISDKNESNLKIDWHTIYFLHIGKNFRIRRDLWIFIWFF